MIKTLRIVAGKMCIHCTMLCPISHAVCDLLGLPRNRFGMIPNTMDILNRIIRRIRSGSEARRTDADFRLYQYLQRNGLWNGFVCDVLQQDIYSAVDHHVINHKFGEHFECVDAGELDVELSVPADMLSTRPDLFRSKMRKTVFVQRSHIGRIKVNDMNTSYEEVGRWARTFDIQLL